MTYSLQSKLLQDFPHGFFLRQGGSSTGLFESLNCDLNSSDNKCSIISNREIVAETIGVNSSNLITLKQKHSPIVIKIEGPMTSNTVEGDAMVTSAKGIGLGILTADCAPILLGESKARIIGVIHAGWRGALDCVVENTVRTMTEIGAERNLISAVIGPCIQQENYEVGDEFLEKFLDRDPKYAKYFNIDNDRKIWFDLPELISTKLRSTGINIVENMKKCTYALTDDFFSHRRNQKNHLGDCGRMISAIKV